VSRHDNVIAFTPPDGRRNGRARRKLVEAVRDGAEQQLEAVLEGLFDNTDDALFELADRSDRNVDQHRYIDAMRDIRLKRLRILRGFKEAYREQFERLMRLENFGDEPGHPDIDGELSNLALVENDELEVSVAISGMVSKAASQHSMALFAVSKRLDSLFDNIEIDESNNPLGPKKLSESFGEAADQLEVDIRVRLILFKLFERHVLAKLEPIYENVNAILSGGGVSQDVRNLRHSTEGRSRDGQSAPPKPAGAHPSAAQEPGPSSASTPSGPRDRAPGGPGGGGELDFEYLRGLMQGDHPSPARVQGPMVSTQELMGVLSQVQASASATPIDPMQTPLRVDFSGLVATSQGQLTRPDEDVVNLVGMLFEFILNDDNLAIPMKALIGRLQIPVLKVALMDHAFFSQKGHPARQLLNELSTAGIGWSSGRELKRDALYEKVESIIERILGQFEQDLQLFEALLAELRTFISKDRRRTQMVEQRLRENESGRARTEEARSEVRKRVAHKMGGLRIPQSVAEFILNVWQRVLIHVHVREGSESKAWRMMLGALDSLLWCSQSLKADDDRAHRKELRRHLEGELQRGLALIIQDPQIAARELKLVTVPLDVIITRDDRLSEDREHDTDGVEPTEEIEVPMSEPEDVPTEELLDPSLLTQARALSEGTWVEYRDAAGGAKRCKLVGIVNPGERYVFANRRGMKIAALSCQEVAQRMAKGDIAVLDDSALFDRALTSLITDLRAARA
jgi:hypothetical protein